MALARELGQALGPAASPSPTRPLPGRPRQRGTARLTPRMIERHELQCTRRRESFHCASTAGTSRPGTASRGGCPLRLLGGQDAKEDHIVSARVPSSLSLGTTDRLTDGPTDRQRIGRSVTSRAALAPLFQTCRRPRSACLAVVVRAIVIGAKADLLEPHEGRGPGKQDHGPFVFHSRRARTATRSSSLRAPTNGHR